MSLRSLIVSDDFAAGHSHGIEVGKKMKAERRSVWVVEFNHSEGWTPLDAKLTKKEALAVEKHQRLVVWPDWKWRVIRYDASK